MRKLVLYVCFALLCLSCKTHKSAVTQNAADSVRVQKMFHVEQFYDTTHTVTSRVVYVFDTVFVKEPKADTQADAETWARQQRVRMVIVENSETQNGITSGSVKAQNDSTAVQKIEITEKDIKREADNGLWLWLIVGTVAVVVVGGVVVYFWFRKYFI